MAAIAKISARNTYWLAVCRASYAAREAMGWCMNSTKVRAVADAAVAAVFGRRRTGRHERGGPHMTAAERCRELRRPGCQA